MNFFDLYYLVFTEFNYYIFQFQPLDYQESQKAKLNLTKFIIILSSMTHKQF